MRGFSLLEIMVALAILGLSLTAISQSQQNSMRAANRAKLTSVAVMLARYKMVEIEDDLFEEGFSDFEDKEEGDFKEEGFTRYSYTLKVDKVELPTAMDAESLGSALDSADGEKSSGDEDSPQSSMMNMGMQMLSKQFEMIRNVLEQSIRRVELKVKWKEGSKEREISVVGYFTDPRKIDAAVGGTLDTSAIPGQGDTAGSTGTSGGTTRTPTRTLPPFGGRRGTSGTSGTTPGLRIQ